MRSQKRLTTTGRHCQPRAGRKSQKVGPSNRQQQGCPMGAAVREEGPKWDPELQRLGCSQGCPPPPTPRQCERGRNTLVLLLLLSFNCPSLLFTWLNLPEGKLLKQFRAQQRNGGSDSESKRENSWYRAQRHLGYSQASLLKTDEGVFSL